MKKLPSLADELRRVILNDKRSAKERFRDMVARGAINEKGEVLLIGPGHDYPPIDAAPRAADPAEEEKAD